MSIIELTQYVKESSKTMTAEKRTELLMRAKIITREGNYNSRFFSVETIQKDREKAR